jgi:ABC-3C biological conflict system middle component
VILPTKHVPADRALIGIGAELIRLLRRPMTVSALWDAVRMHRASGSPSSPIAYDWFVLALDLLHILGAVKYQDGVIRRDSP